MTENLRETSTPATPVKAERFSSTKVRGQSFGGERGVTEAIFGSNFVAHEIAFWPPLSQLREHVHKKDCFLSGRITKTSNPSTEQDV